MLEFTLLARGNYRPDQLLISYDPALHMPVTPDLQQWMDELWQQKLVAARAQQTPLFDAPLFRFVAVNAQTDGTLRLQLGDTSYKQYVTTRSPAFAEAYPASEPGNPLAVCSVVETSDDSILLDKREGVDVYVGRYHVIGGFFERELDMAALPDPFQAMRREIREETGIQAGDIAEQRCLGIVYDMTTPHAEMCFYTRLHIPLAEVRRRVPEENEIKQLRALDVTDASLRDFLLTHHGNISATGEPNLLLYGALKFGSGWYNELMQRL